MKIFFGVVLAAEAIRYEYRYQCAQKRVAPREELLEIGEPGPGTDPLFFSHRSISRAYNYFTHRPTFRGLFHVVKWCVTNVNIMLGF